MTTPVHEQEVDPEKLGDAITELVVQEWLSPRKAAQVLGVHYHTVLEYIKKGHLRAISIGSRNRILYEDLVAFRNNGNRKVTLIDQEESHGIT